MAWPNQPVATKNPSPTNRLSLLLGMGDSYAETSTLLLLSAGPIVGRVARFLTAGGGDSLPLSPCVISSNNTVWLAGTVSTSCAVPMGRLAKAECLE